MTAPGASHTSPAPPPPPAPTGNASGWRARAKIAGIVIAAVAATGALLQGVGAFSSGSKAGSTTTTADHSGNAVNGNQSNSCVASGAGATVNCPISPSPVAAELDDEIAARSIAGTADPTAPGPWPFTVLYDKVAGKNIGLWIRNTSTLDGYHIGLALHAQPVWVDCVRSTDFDPEPGLSTGPRWYKVHWPRADRSDAPASSSPSDPAQGWAYAYYLRPNGTNGKVPTC